MLPFSFKNISHGITRDISYREFRSAFQETIFFFFSFPFSSLHRSKIRERERKKSDAISTFDDSWIFFFFSFFFEDPPRCEIFDLIPVPERALH